MKIKNKLKIRIFLLVMAVLLLALIPGAAMAADNEYVLSTINHTSAKSSVDVSGSFSATLTVPNSTTGNIDLSSGLTITYNTSLYSGAIADWPSGSTATVDGAAVEMKVTYWKTGDSNPYYSTYSISVKKAAYVAPAFSGSISKSVNLPNTVSFSATDFSGKYTQNDGNALAYISIDGSNPSFGSLKYSGSNYALGSKISISSLSSLNFTATGSGTVSYIVYAYTSNDASATAYGPVLLNITVSNAVITPSTISYTTAKNTTLTISATDLNNVCYNATGKNLDYVKFTLPSSSYGTLYYNTSTAVTANTAYYRSSSPYLSYITLVPYTNYTGSFYITYTAYNTDGTSYTGSIYVTVTSTVGTVGTISYTTSKNTTLSFSVSDFNTVCYNATGLYLSYVKFTLPSSSYGTLYYNTSTAATASTAYYYSSSPYLSYISLIPYTNYTGSFYITYTAYNTAGTSYTGYVYVTVSDSNTITYSVDQGEELQFSVSDFEDACDDATNRDLNYIKFTSLPSSSKGKLYYNYTSSSNYDSEVSKSTKYYADSSPYIKYISFVPDEDYEGTFTISYTGYDVKGNTFTGEVQITVEENDTDTADIKYSVAEGGKVQLSVSDFEDACDDATNRDLDYIKFTSLPSTSAGRLYYNYTSYSNYDSVVSKSTKYYAEESPYIKYVSFVANDDYEGTIYIPYTGYNVKGTSFTGKIKITIGDGNSASDGTITYKTKENTALTFKLSDFTSICADETNGTLSYIKFTSLPISANGILYYNYTSSSTYDSLVSKTAKYYKSSSPYISKITFVPQSGYSGTITVSYLGYDTDGDSFSGQIKIIVGDGSDADVITYSTDANKTLTLKVADFTNACDDVTDGTLSYIKFTALPSSAYGKLYYDYTSSSSYDSAVATGTKYYRNSSPYISKITFVPAACGTASISYTGYDTDGESFTGTIKITITGTTEDNTSVSDYFTDINSDYTWAATSIDYLYSKGIVAGVTTSTYGPKNNITRADFIVMLQRAFNLQSTAATSNFSDVDKSSYYYQAVAIAKALGIAEGSGANFNPKKSLTREDAMVLIARTLEVSNITITAGTTSSLSSYTDKDSISGYATTAVATLVKNNIITGSDGKLNPKNNITRAEMAVILYRIVTKY